MTFLAAGWLALLLPWVALAVWAWRRVADERATTAAFLWQSPGADARPKVHRAGTPPAWVIAALLASLAAIVALAAPARRTRVANVAIVVDGSVSLAAKVEGETRRSIAIEAVVAAIEAAKVRVTTNVVIAGVPNPRPLKLAEVNDAPFTPRATAEALGQAVARELREADAVIAVTDGPLAVSDGRLAVVAPPAIVDNIGIESAVAVSTPRPSVMVRIRSDSERTSATVQMAAADSRESIANEAVQLAPRGQTRNYFFDLDRLPDTVTISLGEMDDAFALDDVATILRTSPTPRLIVEPGAPEVAARFASAFERTSPAGEGSNAVAIRLMNQPTDGADPREPSIVFASQRSTASGELRARDHPILSNIDLASPSIGATGTVPSEWKPIAWIGNVPVIAVRDEPRSVWLGFELDSREPRSVMLLANAADWISAGEGGRDRWIGHGPDEVGNDWRLISTSSSTKPADRLVLEVPPGRYRDASDCDVTVNVPAIANGGGQSRGDIAGLLRAADRAGWINLRRPLATLAGLLAIVAAALVPRGRVP